MNLKIIKSVYHRNGISGIGFYALEIEWVEEGRDHWAIATVNADDIEATRKRKNYNPDTRIVTLNKAGQPCIEETMRGDRFHEDLISYLIEQQKAKR